MVYNTIVVISICNYIIPLTYNSDEKNYHKIFFLWKIKFLFTFYFLCYFRVSCVFLLSFLLLRSEVVRVKEKKGKKQKLFIIY